MKLSTLVDLNASMPRRIRRLTAGPTLADSVLPCQAKVVEAKSGQEAETDRQRLLGLESARDAASGENDTGQQCELDAVGLVVGDAVAAQRVQSTDGHTGDDRRLRSCTDEASGAAASGQGCENVCD